MGGEMREHVTGTHDRRRRSKGHAEILAGVTATRHIANVPGLRVDFLRAVTCASLVEWRGGGGRVEDGEVSTA